MKNLLSFTIFLFFCISANAQWVQYSNTNEILFYNYPANYQWYNPAYIDKDSLHHFSLSSRNENYDFGNHYGNVLSYSQPICKYKSGFSFMLSYQNGINGFRTQSAYLLGASFAHKFKLAKTANLFAGLKYARGISVRPDTTFYPFDTIPPSWGWRSDISIGIRFEWKNFFIGTSTGEASFRTISGYKIKISKSLTTTPSFCHIIYVGYGQPWAPSMLQVSNDIDWKNQIQFGFGFYNSGQIDVSDKLVIRAGFCLKKKLSITLSDDIVPGESPFYFHARTYHYFDLFSYHQNSKLGWEATMKYKF